MVESFGDHANLKNDPEIMNSLDKGKSGTHFAVIGF